MIKLIYYFSIKYSKSNFMKSSILKNLAALCLFIMSTGNGYSMTEDSTGVPGDHFNLQAALELFKNSETVEAFEKALNTENNHVNNLDLNEDGEIDYIRVESKMENNVHIFILQVPVSENENQDIAVIELEKTGDEEAMIQIIGDEDIFGEALIVEPMAEEMEEDSDEAVPGMKKGGPNEYGLAEDMAIVINVWGWPSVRFVYGPAYRPWISPWRWRYYPSYWKPWRPLSWRVWHPFRIRPVRGFGICHTHRVVHAHRVYTPHRVSSVSVRTRHSKSIGNYRVTKTKTTTIKKGPAGKTKVKKTRTTTRVKKVR